MLELVINFTPQIEHDVLADGIQQHGLKIRKHEPEELGADIEEPKQSKALRHPRHDVPVDGVLGE